MRSSFVFVILLLATSIPHTHVAAQNYDGTCDAILVPAMQQVGLEPTVSAPILGCEPSGTNWRMRTLAEIQPSETTVMLTQRGLVLQSSIDRMAMDDVFMYALKFDRSTSSVYTLGGYGVVNTSDLSDEGIGAGPNWLNNISSSYTQAMQVYLLNVSPDYPELVQYMDWFMSRRDATLQAMSGGMNPMHSGAFLSNWGFQQFPWFWQLSDPVAISDYLQSLEETGIVKGDPIDTLLLVPFEIVFVSAQGKRLLGGCVVVYEMVAEREYIFACDNNLEDLDPANGSIRLDVIPGNYNVVVNIWPIGYKPEYDPDGVTVEVTEEGATKFLRFL